MRSSSPSFLATALLVLSLGTLSGTGTAHAAARDEVTATDILRTVREMQAGRNETMDGQLRTGEGQVLPFRLTAAGPVVRYAFSGPPAVILQVRYNEDNSQLEEVGGDGDKERLNPANFDKKIFGTDLTYEDLALRFVYWRRATLLESDDATTFAAYKLRLNSPSRQSQYSYVLLWVAKETGAMLRAEGYNFDGKLVKRMTVVHVQKLEGRWYLKQLRIENIDPATGNAAHAPSYLEIKDLAHQPSTVR